EVRYFLDYEPQPLPDNFEQELIMENLEVFVSEESTYEARNAVFEGYTGFRGQWMESKDYAVFSSFDTDHDGFNSIYHKRKKQIVAQGVDLREDQRYHMIIPTHFQAADAEGNRFVIVLPGYRLVGYLDAESPFYEQVNQDPETMFVMEVVLRGKTSSTLRSRRPKLDHHPPLVIPHPLIGPSWCLLYEVLDFVSSCIFPPVRPRMRCLHSGS